MSGLGDKPAFPTLGDDFMDTPDRGRMPKSAYGMNGDPGMTYREWVAGLCAAGAAADSRAVDDPVVLAAWAVKAADALIAALEAPPGTTPKPARVVGVECPDCHAAPGVECVEDGLPVRPGRAHRHRVYAFAAAYEPDAPPSSPGGGR